MNEPAWRLREQTWRGIHIHISSTTQSTRSTTASISIRLQAFTLETLSDLPCQTQLRIPIKPSPQSSTTQQCHTNSPPPPPPKQSKCSSSKPTSRIQTQQPRTAASATSSTSYSKKQALPTTRLSVYKQVCISSSSQKAVVYLIYLRSTTSTRY